MRKQYTAEQKEKMVKIGQRLREVRKNAGLSLGEIADRLNRDFGATSNKGMISKYENGIHEPSAGTVYCLSKILGVSSEYILGRSDELTKSTALQGEECEGYCLGVYKKITEGDWEPDLEAVELIPKSQLIGGREFFGYFVSTNRMAPRYYDGDLIVFERKQKAKIEQTVLAKIGKDPAFLARVNKKRGGKIIIPLDPAADEKFYSTDEIAAMPVKILGVAVQLRRSEEFRK